ncbi:MAG: arginine--tRNA ligase [Bacteroidetes bacterium]|nr:arginine--tRNA ligase [Bacteroidota bacterium]
MNIDFSLRKQIALALNESFGADITADSLSLQPTRKEFTGTYTFVTFPFLKISKMKPEETGEIIGDYLKSNSEIVEDYNVVQGFLNLHVSDMAWIKAFSSIVSNDKNGFRPSNGRRIMVEYSSPNTNKPLHLGHLRNNFLGYSVSKIYEALGYDIIKAQIINDRGIHICKSMVAWEKYGNGETPETSGMKGDKLVGKYYVAFEKQYRQEVNALVDSGLKMVEAEKKAPIMLEAVEMLRKWEAKEAETYALWETMNNWVYKGFEITYNHMGVTFDKLYYESDTYLRGKKVVQTGLDKGVFYKKEDGSVWIDLSADGLDEKLLLRSDGTAVYITQDIGTAIERFTEYPDLEKLVYTVGNEQDYHFKVLFLILKKLEYSWADGCHHLSYGMVDLPTGKMKSREGTVVDADDLMDEMEQTALQHTQDLGKIEGFDEAQAANLYRMVGLGALKYFLLKVDPRKGMLFNPQESIQFQGNTGPFIQYTFARISALLRRAKETGIGLFMSDETFQGRLHEHEREVIYLLTQFESRINEAAGEYSPAVIAQYIFELAKEYNKFYQEVSIFGEQDEAKKRFRISFSYAVARTIKSGMGLLGIEVPERM